VADDIAQLIDGIRLITAANSETAGAKTKGSKGVIIDSKAGNKPSAAPKVSSTLTANEQTRYTKIFEILRDVINPDPEAVRTGSTAQQKVKDISQTTQMAGEAAKEAKDGLLSKLATIGLLLAGLGKTLWALIKKKFFEYLGKFVKFLKNAFVKFFKGVGKLMARFGRFLLRSAKRAGRAIWNGLKKLGRRVLSFLKNTAKAAGKRVADLFKGIWNSKWATSLKGAITNAFGKLGEFMSKARNFVKNAAKSVVQSIPGGGMFMKGFEAVKGAVGKTVEGAKYVGGKAVEGVKGAVGKTVEGAKYVGGKAVQGAKYVGGKAVQGVKYVGGAVINSAKQAKAALGKVLKPMIKTGGGKILTKIPIVGSAIEAGFTAYDINKYANDPKKGEQELKKLIGNRVIDGIGGVAGGTLAAALTAATGAGALVSVPAFFLGDMLGRYVAKLFTNQFDMSSLGGLVMDAFNISPTSSKEERLAATEGVMQDFIVENGKVHPFSDKDSVLGMKPGGAIDNLINSRDSAKIENAAVFDNIRDINVAQLQILTSIRDGIMALGSVETNRVQKSPRPGPSTVELKPNQLTSDYWTATA